MQNAVSNHGPAGSPQQGGHYTHAKPVMELWSDTPTRNTSPLINAARIRSFFVNRWRIILLSVVIAICVSVAGGYFVFNKFTANALVIVDPRSARVTQGQDVLPAIGSDAFAIESIVQISKSPGFLGKVVTHLKLTSDSEFGGPLRKRNVAIDQLSGRLSISRRGATYVIDVAATSKDARKSRRIANAAAKLIVEDQARIRTESTEKAIIWLTGRLRELQMKLRRSENAAAALKASLKLTDAGQGFTLQERRITELTRQTVLAATRTTETRARLDQLRRSSSNLNNLPSSIQSSVLTGLRRDMARVKRLLAEQSSVLGARHPAVARMQAQIRSLRRQMRAELANMRKVALSEVRAAQKRQRELTTQLRKAEDQSGRQGKDAVRLAELEREAKADRAVYEQLLARLKELSEFRNLKLKEVRIASPALTPWRTAGPKMPLLVVAGLMLGLFGGLGLAAGLEFISKGDQSRRKLERKIVLPVIGGVPQLEQSPDGQSSSEAIARFQAGIAGAADKINKARTVLVTSVYQGDGKSTVASELATEFSRRGREVLVIEANSPGLNQLVPATGLIDILQSGTGLEKAIDGPTAGDYFVLPFGGKSVSDGKGADDLLRGKMFRRILRQCGLAFDMVIVDAGELNNNGVSGDLSELTEATLLVVPWDKAGDKKLAKICTQIPDALVLLNNIDRDVTLVDT